MSATEIAKKIKFDRSKNVYEELDLTLTPYLVPLLELIGDNRVELLGALASTQSAKTVFLQAALSDSIEQDPGSFMYIMPDETTAERGCEEKLQSVINHTPSLAKHKTKRVTDMNKNQITLDNMDVYVAWGGSPQSMNSLPMKRVAWDEVRLMPLTIGTESNAIKLGWDRLTTYLDMGLAQGYMASSPSTEGDLLHQQLDIKGTVVLEWQVPCPVCGEFQRLDFFENIVYIKEYDRVECQCKHCKGVFPDGNKKREWNNKGVYAPVGTRVNKDGSLEQPYKLSKRMFFWWDSLVSPFRDFRRIWDEFVTTRDKPHDYKNFWQAWLAKFWIEDVSKTNAQSLELRKAPYVKRSIPPISVLLAGGDTQDNGFYINQWGFAPNKKCYLVDEYFIDCPISTTTSEDIEFKLNRDVIERVYKDPSGTAWRPFLFALDSGGHRTKALYAAFKKLKRSILVKGNNTQSQSIIYSKNESHYNVRTCEYLEETERLCMSDSFHLPTDVSRDFLSQFVAMRKKQNTNKRTGETKVEWIKKGQCDHRMASVHAFICLDIPLDVGELRSEIEKGLIFNPVPKKVVPVKKVIQDDSSNEPEYSLGNFDW